MEEAVAPSGLPKAMLLGFMFIMIGIVLIIASTIYEAMRSGGKTGFGAVVVIGPVPIVVGNNPTLVKIAIIGAIILMVLAFVLILAPGILAKKGLPP